MTLKQHIELIKSRKKIRIYGFFLDRILKSGIHADLTPTMDHEWTVEEWYRYLKSVDKHMREFAEQTAQKIGEVERSKIEL